jgi:hypothetical protein
MTLRLFGALATAALAAACGGMGDDSQPTYRDVLMERYPPIERAMEAAVEPCLREDLPQRSRHYGEAKEHVERLLAELEEVDPPAGLEQADAQFRRGLTDIAELLGETGTCAGKRGSLSLV